MGTFPVSSFNLSRLSVANSHPRHQSSAKTREHLALLQPQSSCRPRTASFIARIKHPLSHPPTLYLPPNALPGSRLFPITNSLDVQPKQEKAVQSCPGDDVLFVKRRKTAASRRMKIYKKRNRNHVDDSSHRGRNLQHRSCYESDSVHRISFQIKTSTASGTPYWGQALWTWPGCLQR